MLQPRTKLDKSRQVTDALTRFFCSEKYSEFVKMSNKDVLVFPGKRNNNHVKRSLMRRLIRRSLHTRVYEKRTVKVNSMLTLRLSLAGSDWQSDEMCRST